MRWALALALLLLGGAARAQADLVFIAASNHAEPLSRFDEKDRLIGGILKELGDLLARQLGRQARYLTLPSKRAPQGLRDGLGDLICYSRPQWIGADLYWTAMFIPNAEVIAAHADSPPLQRLEQLEGQRVGTVLGYRYGDTEVRARLLRDDAPDMTANLRKLAAGRTPYALTDLISLRAAQRQQPKLRLALQVERFGTGCALSPKSQLKPAELESAVQALVKAGEIERLLARYR